MMMDLLITAATYALGAVTLMVALSLIMVPVVACFIFKNRKDLFDGYRSSRKNNRLGYVPKSNKKPPKPLHPKR